MKWLHLTALLTLALALPVQAQKDKKKDDKKPDAEVLESEKVLNPGPFSGKVVKASETAIQVRVDYIHYELKDLKGVVKNNTSGDRQLQQLLRQQQQLSRARDRYLRARNPQEQWRALQELQQMSQKMQQAAAQAQIAALLGNTPQQNLFKEVHEYKDVNVELDDSCKYRTSFLPMVYDDMGNPKKFSEEEKKEMKGDPKLAGYKAAATDVKAGQKVTITLAKVKDKEDEKKAKLRGTMVLITEEANEPLKSEKKPKK